MPLGGRVPLGDRMPLVLGACPSLLEPWRMKQGEAGRSSLSALGWWDLGTGAGPTEQLDRARAAPAAGGARLERGLIPAGIISQNAPERCPALAPSAF